MIWIILGVISCNTDRFGLGGGRSEYQKLKKSPGKVNNFLVKKVVCIIEKGCRVSRIGFLSGSFLTTKLSPKDKGLWGQTSRELHKNMGWKTSLSHNAKIPRTPHQLKVTANNPYSCVIYHLFFFFFFFYFLLTRRQWFKRAPLFWRDNFPDCVRRLATARERMEENNLCYKHSITVTFPFRVARGIISRYKTVSFRVPNSCKKEKEGGGEMLILTF